MRTAAEKKNVAMRPAAGGESCKAGFFFMSVWYFTISFVVRQEKYRCLAEKYGGFY